MLVVFLLGLRLGTLKNSLWDFQTRLLGLQVPKTIFSIAALSVARKKLSYQAFVDIHRKILDFYHREGAIRLWNNFRLIAIDGSTFRLPGTTSLLDAFGSVFTNSPTPCCLARASLAYDPINELVLDAQLAPFNDQEHTLAFRHLENLNKDDKTLFILDRGYISYPLWYALLANGSHFCIRLRADLHLVKALNASGSKDLVVHYSPRLRSDHKKLLADLGLEPGPLKIRVIKLERPGKQTFYLATTLLDAASFPPAEIAHLYSLRWNVEEDYKVKKCRLEIENFSGKTPNVILQDFWSKIVYQNLMVMLRHPTIPQLEADNLKRNLDYKFNDKDCLAGLRHAHAFLFLEEEKSLSHLIGGLQTLWLQCLSAIRPGRKYYRKNKGRTGGKTQGYFFPYTRIC